MTIKRTVWNLTIPLRAEPYEDVIIRAKWPLRRSEWGQLQRMLAVLEAAIVIEDADETKEAEAQ